MLPHNRITTQPGEILQFEFLEPMGLSQSACARHIGVNRFVINELVRRKRGVSARVAIMLSRALNTSAEFWMGLQADYEMSSLLQSEEGKRVRSIGPIAVIH